MTENKKFDRRDREILLDTAMRLYIARRAAIAYTDVDNDSALMESCISDAFDLAVPMLHTPIREATTPVAPNTSH